MNAMNEMPAPLNFTDAAAEKVRSLIEEEGNPELKLRVFVTGGGCSGFQYGFTFDEAVAEDDTSMVKNGVTLLIDPMSYQYLAGAEIDYTAPGPETGPFGARFALGTPFRLGLRAGAGGSTIGAPSRYSRRMSIDERLPIDGQVRSSQAAAVSRPRSRSIVRNARSS